MENKIQLKHYKEHIASFLKRRLDLSGNITRNFQLIKKNVQIFKARRKIIKKLKPSLLKNLMLLFYMWKLNINFPMLLKHVLKKIRTRLSECILAIQKLVRLNKKFQENRYVQLFRTYVSKRLRRPFRRNVQTNKIKFNPFFKFKVPGYPKFKAKKRLKLRKKLLICRLRNKSKFLMIQKSIALHSFIGTNELSYASLVKNNKLSLVSILYQYRIRKKKKTRISYKERKLIKRPFKLIRMNQARFHTTDHPIYSIFFKNINEQLNYAYNKPVMQQHG